MEVEAKVEIRLRLRWRLRWRIRNEEYEKPEKNLPDKKLNMMRKTFFLFLCVCIIASCKEKEPDGEFVTYHVEQVKHKIVMNEHYIYSDRKIISTDSEYYLNKIIKYVDTVKQGKPIISVSVIDQKFPENPDYINWQKISKSVYFEVWFNEDSLVKDRYYIEKVLLKS